MYSLLHLLLSYCDAFASVCLEYFGTVVALSLVA